jgi:hypothetical protein
MRDEDDLVRAKSALLRGRSDDGEGSVPDTTEMGGSSMNCEVQPEKDVEAGK